MGGALVASAGTVIVGLGMLWFSTLRQDPVHRAGDRAEPGDRAGRCPDTGAGAALTGSGARSSGRSSRRITCKGPTAKRRAWSRCRMTGFWLRVADLVVKYPVAILTLCLLGAGAPGRDRCPDPAQLQPARRPRPRPAQRHRRQRDPPLLRRRRAQPDGRPGRAPAARLPVARGAQTPIAEVSRRCSAIPNVAEVRSVSQPLGKPPAARTPTRASSQRHGRTGHARRRPIRATSAPSPPTRPTSTTSPGSTWSSSPTRSPTTSLDALETVCARS